MTVQKEKNVLAIDTSGKNLILGMSFGGDRLVKSKEVIEKSHGQFIIKKISELFQSAGIKKENLDAIIVSTGPGSFTGLRIGIAAAKGIAVALEIPVVGVSRFEIAAFKLRHMDKQVSVVIPLKKDEFYVTRVYQGKCSNNEVRIVAAKDLSESIDEYPVAGMGLNLQKHFTEVNNVVVADEIEYDASDLIHLGVEKMSSGISDDLTLLQPLYLQKSRAEINFELRNKK